MTEKTEDKPTEKGEQKKEDEKKEDEGEKKVDQLIMVLAAEVDGKPMIAAMLSDSIVEKGELNAGNLVRELAKEIKGGGNV